MTTVGLSDVTQKYIYRKKVVEYMQYYDMKCAKEMIEQQEKSLKQIRLQLLLDTQMIDTRSTMKGKYEEKGKYNCPHCSECPGDL